jgi:hypothetical protein
MHRLGDVRGRFGDPIVVGGTGGSGMRSIVQLLISGGACMGTHLNAEKDAGHMAYFDWQWGRHLLNAAVDSPGEVAQSPVSTRCERAFWRAVRRHLRGAQPGSGQPWGWKHADSYLLLPALRRYFPGLRFVHVIRDGRDMAFSGNQRQTHRYGPLLSPEAGAGPVGSAAYWSAANLYTAAGGAALESSYFLLRLEDLCAEPTKVAYGLLRWAGLLSPSATVDSASWAEQLVRTPRSLGRWRTSQYDRLGEVVAAAAPGLAHFGYDS